MRPVLAKHFGLASGVLVRGRVCESVSPSLLYKDHRSPEMFLGSTRLEFTYKDISPGLSDNLGRLIHWHAGLRCDSEVICGITQTCWGCSSFEGVCHRCSY